jgi:hypothetical protein
MPPVQEVYTNDQIVDVEVMLNLGSKQFESLTRSDAKPSCTTKAVAMTKPAGVLAQHLCSIRRGKKREPSGARLKL